MRLLLSLVLALVLAASAHAQWPQPPEVAARQYLLIDLSSGQVLAERDADAHADPASLTKLMTAYLVFNAIRDKKLSLEQTLPVSQRAWAERRGGGSLMFIDTTMQPKVDELLKGMIVQSGNDASVALAEAVGGTLEQFVEMMNRQAQAWGLKNTQYRNVTGLTEPGHYSSAREMPNGKRRLLSVVLGTASREARAAESQKLLNWGWQAWDALRLFDAGQAVMTVPVWKGRHAEARLGAPGAIYVTVPKGEGQRLKTSVERTDPLIAPLAAGQRVGTLTINLASGAKVAERPLQVLEEVPQAGILGRAWDALRLWIK